MWDHSAVLRYTLLVGSILTLSALHVEHKDVPSVWSIARLVPLTLYPLSIAAIVGHLVSVLHNATDLLHALVGSATIAHSTLLLVYFLYNRRWLHRLLHDVSKLSRITLRCGRPSDFSSVRRHPIVFAAVSSFELVYWFTGFFSSQEMKHPNYLLAWWVPEMLRPAPWYFVTLTLQVAFVIILTTMQLVFDVVLFCFLDALALFQERLGRYIREFSNQGRALDARSSDQLSENVEKRDEDTSSDILDSGGHAEDAGKKANTCGLVAVSHSARPVNIRDGKVPPVATIDTGVVRPGSCHRPSDLNITTSHDALLEWLTEVFTSVRQLSSDANALFSVPILSLHACVTTNLLLGSYVSKLLYHSDKNNLGEQMYGFGVFTLVVVLRLLLLSSAGSRLIQQGQQLHEQLAAARWPASRMSSGEKLLLQMLLERARSPIAFEGWGLFTVQKGTMLALFSFVLTYFIIMVQMDVA